MPTQRFDRVVDRRATNSLKWDRYAGRDVIPMWVADMDFRAPEPVVEALRACLEHGIFGYTRPGPGLEAAVCRSLAERHGWEVSPAWIVWLPGVVPGLNVTCRAVGRPGDEVLTVVPIYPPFLTAPGQAERKTATLPLSGDGDRWHLDTDRLRARLTPRTRLLLLSNPHNPTGRVFTRAELEDLLEVCQAHDLVICADEIHCDLVLEPGARHVPMAALGPEAAARTVTLMAPSKTFNIPGLACSFAVISEEGLRQRFQRAMAGFVPSVNLFGLAAAESAYGDPACWEWLDDLRGYLRVNRDLTMAALQRMPGLAARPPEATYLAWIDARAMQPCDPARFFEDHGVGLSDGAEFGAPGFLRLNFGCPRSTLEAGLARMAKALAGGAHG
jgi:cystathionine beta-lyase